MLILNLPKFHTMTKQGLSLKTCKKYLLIHCTRQRSGRRKNRIEFIFLNTSDTRKIGFNFRYDRAFHAIITTNNKSIKSIERRTSFSDYVLSNSRMQNKITSSLYFFKSCVIKISYFMWIFKFLNIIINFASITNKNT